MRLARGSGLDGLTGIAPSTRLGAAAPACVRCSGCRRRVCAPRSSSAASPGSRTRATSLPAFERTRLRAAQGELDALGLTGEMLGLSARRLQRARAALDAMTDRFCAEPDGAVHTDPCGVLTIDRDRLRRAPEEIALRLLDRCIAAAGGSGEPVPLAKLEAIVDSLRRPDGPESGSWTLSRALIAATRARHQVEREPGRLPLPRLVLAGGASALWDGRFAVAVAEGWEGTVEVRALGADGLAELRRLGRTVKAARALQLVPSFWRDGRLLAVPAIDFCAAAEA